MRKILLAFSIGFCFSLHAIAGTICNCVLIEDTCIQESTVGMTPSGIVTFPCSAVNAGDRWYKYIVPACSDSVRVDLFGGTYTGRGLPSLYLYLGACDSLDYQYCEYCWPSDTVVSKTFSGLNAGDTILIRVRAGTTDGLFDLCITNYCSVPQSVSGLTSLQLIVWPIPASEILHIHFPLVSKTAISIYDATGRKVMEKNSENSKEATIDVSRIQPGIYFLILRSDTISVAEKIIVD